MIHNLPLLYKGFDISSSIRPERADMVFHLVQQNGFVTDSLIFFDIPLETDSSLYTSLTSFIKDTSSVGSVIFFRAVFHFTKSSYEKFRDRILQIDRYYAASLIADSTLIWAGNGFLSETGNRAEMIMRQLELERIIKYIRPQRFNPDFGSGLNDIEGLTSKYQQLMRVNNRMKAIIEYTGFLAEYTDRTVSEKDLLKNYLDRLDHYHSLAFGTDFRYVTYIDSLASPEFSNAGIIKLQQEFIHYDGINRYNWRTWSRMMAIGLVERGDKFGLEGNQLRAITYYNSAYSLCKIMNLDDLQSAAFQQVGQMMNSISSSYIEISRKSANADNPSLAAQYFHDALQIFKDEQFASFKPGGISDYEKWLYLNFENQAVKYIDLMNYNKALGYLIEIQYHCQTDASYSCPEDFHQWMRTVRDGIYHDLLKKSQNLLLRDEWQDAGKAFRQAIATRMKAGYRIEKDGLESVLEVEFRQMQYEDLIEEGIRYMNNQEFSSALFYFNKAEFLEKMSLNGIHPELADLRQTTARQVMLQLLSDGRVKAWGKNYENARTSLQQVAGMLADYRIPESDSLTVQYLALMENINNKECEMVTEEFNDLLEQIKSAKAGNDFILAREIAEDAVTLSLEHLNCRISDGEAWYEKVLLETPADFQLMELQLNDMIDASCNDYLKSFQDLKNYYYRHKLLDQGIVFLPLFDRVVRADNPEFLAGMLNHYISLKDFDHSFRLLERLSELGVPSKPLSDQQKSVAEFYARRDAKNPAIAEPWETLGSYTGRNEWYRTF
ncbi:MAG: hypothetical protein HGA23_04865 [Bacteroidales bacterium]|nr:hypothetical protein [Bacteroidales bacterium]